MKRQTKYKIAATETDFGHSFDLESLIPRKSDLVVVCINRGLGIIPTAVLLPHQIYAEDVDKLLREDQNITEIVVYPLKSKRVISIWNKK